MYNYADYDTLFNTWIRKKSISRNAAIKYYIK